MPESPVPVHGPQIVPPVETAELEAIQAEERKLAEAPEAQASTAVPVPSPEASSTPTAQEPKPAEAQKASESPKPAVAPEAASEPGDGSESVVRAAIQRAWPTWEIR